MTTVTKSMIEKLLMLENKVLPELVRDEWRWQSLNINYHPPYVDRLFTEITDFEDGPHRLMLHMIYPSKEGAALYHPHPWPSAVHVLNVLGTMYQMGVGRARAVTPEGALTSPSPAELELACDVKMIATGELWYEMLEPKAYHYVRPLYGESLSTMLVGPPWKDTEVVAPSTKPERKLKPLSPTRLDLMFALFRDRFPRR